MESLKTLQDLEAAGTKLHTPFLKHIFRDFSPISSPHLQHAIVAYHPRDRLEEVLDFRAAYHQFADWLFGWNVSELAASAAASRRNTPGAGPGAAGGGAGPPPSLPGGPGGMASSGSTEMGNGVRGNAGDPLYTVHRVPRNIDLDDPTERLECTRLLETFQTQYSMGVRHLRRAVIHLEERLPLVGKNIALIGAAGDDGPGDNEDEHAVWGDAANAAGGGAIALDGSSPSGGGKAPSAAVKKPSISTAAAAAAAGMPSSAATNIDATDLAIDALLQSVADTLAEPPTRAERMQAESSASLASSAVGSAGGAAGRHATSLAHHTAGKRTGGAGGFPPTSSSRRGSNPALGSARAKVPLITGASRRGSGLTTPLPEIPNSSAKSSAGGSGRRTSISGGVGREPRPASSSSASGSAQGSRQSSPEHAPPTGAAVSPAPPTAGTAAPSATTALTAPRRPPSPPRAEAAQMTLTEAQILQQDIDALYLDVSMTLDLYLATSVAAVVVLSFAELMNDKPLYTKYAAHTHALAMQLVATAVRATWDLTRRAAPACGQPVPAAAQLCDLTHLRNILMGVLKTRSYKPGEATFLALSRLTDKLHVLHGVLVGVDVFLFPMVCAAHPRLIPPPIGAASAVWVSSGGGGAGSACGVKALWPTTFDNNVWATGGYDCKLRIFDIAEGVCLAQFSGHKSIVTEVHFVKADAYLVSSSFDKTIKVWNAQTATCERTLVGHSDAITSCDVSPQDARYIISGSLDGTVRLWEFATGECLAVVKKHARYVKCVKFSPDGRYAASAGLDRRVYIWDVKMMAYSKSITHVRCIEAHDDYILALDMARPALLVTVARDAFVKLWDYMSGHCIYSVSLSPAWACTVAFGTDAELFAVGCFDNSVHVFRTKTGERVRMLKVLNSGVLAVRFPKRGYECIMVGTAEGLVQKLRL